MIETADARAPAAAPVYTLYLALLLVLYATHLDLYLEAADRLHGLNPIHLFVASCAPFLLWLLVGPDSDGLLARALAALHGSALPLLFFLLWLAGHVLFLGGAVMSGEVVDFTQYFPVYQLAVCLIGLLLGAVPGFARAVRPAAALAILLLAGTVIYDAFAPGTFSRDAGRAAGVAVNANVAAFDLLLLLAVAVRYGEARLRDALLIALTLVAVVVTFSRGGLLLAAIFLAAYGAALLTDRRGRALSRLLAPAAGLLLAGIGLYWLLGTAAIVHLPGSADRLAWFGQGDYVDATQESRVQLLFHYLGLIQASPFLGDGTGGWLAATAAAPWGEGPHDMYLRVWVDQGLWGLLTYLGILGSAFVLFFIRSTWLGIALSLITVANGVFSHNIIDDKAFLLLFGAALASSALGEDAAEVDA